MMDKRITQFAVDTDKRGTVKNIGRSYINQPRIRYDGRKTTWFDDSKLLKKNK